MGKIIVDQIWPDGALHHDVDTSLSSRDRAELLRSALPGAEFEKYAGASVARLQDQVILSKQVTYLGSPWEAYKKRIQIPKYWLDVHSQADRDGLSVRFVGIYHYGATTIFVDFDPSTYVTRKANNSSAHVSVNDLFQAQTLGQFSREDKRGNRLTSVRADQFETYLRAGFDKRNPHIEVLDRFSDAFIDGTRIYALDAVREMHDANWPDKFQNEWAGFYVEFRLSQYLTEHQLDHHVRISKQKRRGQFDYDLRFFDNGRLVHYGDLKASNVTVSDSPGNDASDFFRCLAQTGRFWYVIFEHQTWHGRDNGDISTIAWNDWRRSVGHIGRRQIYDPRSYASRFKESVRFVSVKILEVNQANVGVALGDFQEGFKQADGTPRKSKVMIKKKDIDNFLIYTKSIAVPMTT